MYLILLMWLIICSVLELLGYKRRNILYWICLVWMAFIVCFRFGQGTDYSGYLTNYSLGDGHSELIFVYIQNVFHFMGFDFEVFVFAVGIFCIACTHRAVKKYSPYRCISLLLLYPTIYLTYFMSAMRQGIVIAFFLAFLLPWMLEKKLVKYVVGCVVCGLIHSVALILLPVYFIRYCKMKYLYIVLPASALLGLLLWAIPDSWYSFINIGAFQFNVGIKDIGIYSIIEKAILLVIVINVWKSIPQSTKTDEELLMYKMYLFASAIAFIFMSWGQMASRFSEANRAVIILLFPMLLVKSKRFKELLFTFILAYTGLVVVKNLNSYIVQAGYVNTHLFNYPYISVFKKEKVLFRSDGIRILELDKQQHTRGKD